MWAKLTEVLFFSSQGGGLPQAQQPGRGPETLGDGAGQDEAASWQATEADGRGLPVAEAGGESSGELAEEMGGQ